MFEPGALTEYPSIRDNPNGAVRKEDIMFMLLRSMTVTAAKQQIHAWWLGEIIDREQRDVMRSMIKDREEQEAQK